MDLAARIPEGSTVVSDGHPSYGFAASSWKHVAVDPRDPSTGSINMVNALHSRLEGFLAPFHGVATRRLQRYLDWFCYVEQFKRGHGPQGSSSSSIEETTSWDVLDDEAHTNLKVGSLMVYWTRQYPRNVNGGLT
ncbi:MAG: hypothetical protein V8S24_04085 [Gordonibacter pamelaeae]